MRKRRFVCGIALCLALSVAGCGKSSEEKQAAKYYQDELGLDKKDAESLAHELYGKDEEEPSASVPEGFPQKTVSEPLPELVNSEWYDRKVQIYDMVFTMDECLTEEDIRKTVEESAYDFKLSEDFDKNGDVCLTGIVLDGKTIVGLSKHSRASAYVTAGIYEEGDYYTLKNYTSYWTEDGQIRYESPFYYKPNMEIEALDFKTRDDVLAYLAENGFVEVEAEQAPYKNARDRHDCMCVFTDTSGVEYVDIPHYYRIGAQSIICVFRVHKLYETDQEVAFDKYERYSGCRLNLYQIVFFDFNTDGTIISDTDWSQDLQSVRGWLILGEQIN